MILVTVGTQLPFDRLVRAVDDWANRTGERDIVAQIGATTYKPDCFEAVPFMSPSDLQSRMKRASLIVSHAGMGSIIAALTICKPIIVMPRKASLGEHRNDHQMATARNLKGRAGVTVVWEEAILADLLDKRNTLTVDSSIGESASPDLIAYLRGFFADTLEIRK